MAYKFKKNESFYIRDGWFEKAINEIEECRNSGRSENVFYKNDGIGILGIGSNMVKGLKYWMQSANLISKTSSTIFLTDFGELLFKYDQYLDDVFSWFLIHYFLVKNEKDCPIFNIAFTSNIKSFTKEQLSEIVFNQVIQSGEKPNKKYIDDDVNIFVKSYINDNPEINPEDNFVCPLSNLGLLKNEEINYLKTPPRFNDLDPLIIGFVLSNLYSGKSFVIEDSAKETLGPAQVFNLDKSTYLQYLDLLRQKGLITINKTAGLNSVYFEKDFSLDGIFKEHFGGKR